MARSMIVNPESARDFVAAAARQAPATFNAFQQYCQANNRDSGVISRVRWAQLYSSVSIAYAAGPGIPVIGGTRLYTEPLGSVGPAGVITDRETNLTSAGKLPNGQSFAVASHGFDVYVQTLAAASTPDILNFCIAEIMNGFTARLLTGSETVQIWGPIAGHAYGTYGTGAAATAATAVGFPTGNAARLGVPVEPGLVIEPGQSFSVEVNLRGALSAVAAMGGTTLGLRHWFCGATRTAVDG